MKTRLIIAWLGNLIDIFATLHLMTYFGGEEINPISAFLLQWPPLFIAIKLLSATVAIIGIWYFRNRTIFKVLSWIFFIVYLLVFIYYAAIAAILIFMM